MTLLACVICLCADEFFRHPLAEHAEEPHQGGVLRGLTGCPLFFPKKRLQPADASDDLWNGPAKLGLLRWITAHTTDSGGWLP